MDSDFQKQHTYYNVKETLPIDISQDNITPLISSIRKDKKKKKTCFSSQAFHKLRAQLELHGMAQIFRAGLRPLPARNRRSPRGCWTCEDQQMWAETRYKSLEPCATLSCCDSGGLWKKLLNGDTGKVELGCLQRKGADNRRSLQKQPPLCQPSAV